MTIGEQALWKRLRNGRTGFKFRRQHPIGAYVVDFCCTSSGVCVELDGEGHETYSKEQDRLRDAELSEMGFQVLRFKNYEFALEEEACIRKIVSVCQLRARSDDLDEEAE